MTRWLEKAAQYCENCGAALSIVGADHHCGDAVNGENQLLILRHPPRLKEAA